MRQITQQASLAFAEGRNFKSWNTEITNVMIWSWFISMFLHWNRILTLEGDTLTLDSCGYKTNVTKERLNWVLEAFNLWRIQQKKWVWYFIPKDFPLAPEKEFKNWMTLKINS